MTVGDKNYHCGLNPFALGRTNIVTGRSQDISRQALLTSTASHPLYQFGALSRCSTLPQVGSIGSSTRDRPILSVLLSCLNSTVYLVFPITKSARFLSSNTLDLASAHDLNHTPISTDHLTLNNLSSSFSTQLLAGICL
eukprot:Gb_22021 [translate_table: standard]